MLRFGTLLPLDKLGTFGKQPPCISYEEARLQRQRRTRRRCGGEGTRLPLDKLGIYDKQTRGTRRAAPTCFAFPRGCEQPPFYE